MLTTIILTCYKQEKFIEETILSVINQKYKDWELLIWDDSPDDNCWNIISKYTKKYPNKIRAWHHNPNKWIVNNMQFLLDQRNKESEYVAFLEWDDCLFPEYLEKKLEIFEKYPNVKLVYNELTTVDEEWKIIEKELLKWCTRGFCRKWKISYEKLISQDYNKTWSGIMVRSNILDKYSIFSESLWFRTILSDLYFFNLVAHNEDIYGIEEPLVYYRKHVGSVSNDMQGAIYIYLEIMKYINCMFEQWFISYRFYKDQICRYALIISIVTIKKFLNMWIFRAIRVFLVECVNAFRSRCKRIIFFKKI